MTRALEIDQKALDAYNKIPNRVFLLELVDALRRVALKKLRAGKPEEAICDLSSVPRRYVDLLEYSGINMSQLYVLQPVMAAIKVLLQTGRAANKMLADAGYREGVLEEAWWELGEQRRAAGDALDSSASPLRRKKSKAAKRKQ
jgi:hypothetical protein